MNRLLALLAALGASAMALAGAPLAAPPEHDLFVDHYSYVDSGTCGFPIAVEGVFTNRIIDSTFTDGSGTLQLHQSDVATLTANGVALRTNARFTIFVTFVDSVPVSAKHVGVLDDVTGPNGAHLFFRTGQAVYEVVFDPDLGYYVDGPLVTRHGIRDDFDATEFCAAFGA